MVKTGTHEPFMSMYSRLPKTLCRVTIKHTDRPSYRDGRTHGKNRHARTVHVDVFQVAKDALPGDEPETAVKSDSTTERRNERMGDHGYASAGDDFLRRHIFA